MNINVQKEGLKAGVGCCKVCITTLNQAAKDLKRDYQNAGQGWDDENYKKLGVIIHDCATGLYSPISDIEDVMHTLEEMIKIIEDAESVF